MFAVTLTILPARAMVVFYYNNSLKIMNTRSSLKAFLLAGILGSTGMFPSAHAAPDIAEPEPQDPAVLPAMVPGKMETADSAFAKLDANKKGYLSTEDTKVLEDFDEPFKAADGDGNKKLTPDEFIKGWEKYTGIPSSPDTFQRTK